MNYQEWELLNDTERMCLSLYKNTSIEELEELLLKSNDRVEKATLNFTIHLKKEGIEHYEK